MTGLTETALNVYLAASCSAVDPVQMGKTADRKTDGRGGEYGCHNIYASPSGKIEYVDLEGDGFLAGASCSSFQWSDGCDKGLTWEFSTKNSVLTMKPGADVN